MRDRMRDRLFLVWGMLVAVTLISSQIGGEVGVARLGSASAVTLAVLAIAFAKVWVVMFEFMELRRAPVALRVLACLWLTLVLALLLGIYAGLIPI